MLRLTSPLSMVTLTPFIIPEVSPGSQTKYQFTSSLNCVLYLVFSSWFITVYNITTIYSVNQKHKYLHILCIMSRNIRGSKISRSNIGGACRNCWILLEVGFSSSKLSNYIGFIQKYWYFANLQVKLCCMLIFGNITLIFMKCCMKDQEIVIDRLDMRN